MKLTSKGLVTGLLALLALLAGLAWDNPVYVATGLLGASLLAVSGLTLRGADLQLTRVLKAETVSEGDTVPVELQLLVRRKHGKSLLEVRDALPGEVALADGNNYAILDLRPGEAAELRYAIRCPVKGYHKVGPVRVRVEDPFGMFHIDQDLGGESQLKVYPRVEDLRDAAAKSKYPFVTTGPFLVGNPGQGSAFFALREYTRGDTFRDINWKATARSKTIMVSQRERESQSEITILLDARRMAQVGTVEHNTFLFGCRATASLADYFIGMRNRIRLVAYGEGILRVGPGGSAGVSQEVLEQVTALRASGELSLGDVIDEILPTVKARTPVFVLSSLVDDPHVERGVASLRAFDARVLVVSPDAVAFAEAAAALQGTTEQERAELAVLRAERERLVDALRGMGALVLDWKPGETLAMSLQRGVV
jgi:uncharacterized protein (DUF58 family)